MRAHANELEGLQSLKDVGSYWTPTDDQSSRVIVNGSDGDGDQAQGVDTAAVQEGENSVDLLWL